MSEKVITLDNLVGCKLLKDLKSRIKLEESAYAAKCFVLFRVAFKGVLSIELDMSLTEFLNTERGIRFFFEFGRVYAEQVYYPDIVQTAYEFAVNADNRHKTHIIDAVKSFLTYEVDFNSEFLTELGKLLSRSKDETDKLLKESLFHTRVKHTVDTIQPVLSADFNYTPYVLEFTEGYLASRTYLSDRVLLCDLPSCGGVDSFMHPAWLGHVKDILSQTVDSIIKEDNRFKPDNFVSGSDRISAQFSVYQLLTGKQTGYVYVLGAKGNPNVCKVGKTTRTPRARLKEINSVGYMNRKDWFLRKCFSVVDITAVEQASHVVLNRYKIQGDKREREFFTITPDEAINQIGPIAGPFLSW